MFQIRVPVQPHIKKFIRSYTQLDPIPISNTNFFGFTLFSLLDKNMNYRASKYKLPESELIFCIDEFNWKRSGTELEPVKVILFNKLMHDIFRDKLFSTVDTVLLSYPEYNQRKPVTNEVKHLYHTRIYKRRVEVQVRKPDVKDVILSFLQLHGITEEEFSLDAAKKAYFRHRNEYQQRSKIFGWSLSLNSTA